MALGDRTRLVVVKEGQQIVGAASFTGIPAYLQGLFTICHGLVEIGGDYTIEVTGPQDKVFSPDDVRLFAMASNPKVKGE